MWKNTWCFIALCILAVKAQKNDADSSDNSKKTDPETKIVEPANISSLYIGDLLRTKPKEELEPSDSIHRPVVSERDFTLQSPVAGRVFNYKAHGGHEYVQTEFIKPLLQSRSHLSSALDRNTARSAPPNIMGHLLTLKPVKLVPAHALPAGRDSGSHYENPHHSKEDCSKNTDHSYSSEEKSYPPEQPTYRRERQIAEPEYRSPPSSYSEDDRPMRHYSHSSPSSHDTRSYPSDTRTKSQSSGSYSKSVSKSSSKTERPNRPRQTRIVPEKFQGADDDLKSLGPAHGNQGVVVYKTKESPKSHKSSSHPEHNEKPYSPEYDGRGHRSGHREEYPQHPSGMRRPRQHLRDGPTTYSTTEQQPPNEQYTPYKPDPYAQEDSSYEQKPYDAPVDHRYRKQSKPTNNPHYESGYAAQPDVREQQQQKPYSQNYQSSESPAPYSNDNPRKSHPKRRRPSSHYEKPSSGERENSEYRGREYSAPEYNYAPEHQIQSSRPEDVRPRNNYEAFSPSGSQTGTAPVSHSPYDNDNLALRPSEEKQMNPYVYEATPHQATIKHSERSMNRPYRESSRSARSPGRHSTSVIVEGRANLPKEGTEHVPLVTKESQPQISHSVSYSESSYNMGENAKPKAKQNVKEKEAQQTEGRQASTDYQTSYKPYNSEYPASYANDQREQYKPQTYREPHEQQHSYEDTAQQYHPHNEEQSYEQDGPQEQDHSYEQKEAPVRKGGKNHHYISKIEGYRDTYGPNEHLELDEEFFRKYGISKTAKVIVANAKDEHLFVADGTKIKEGEHFANNGPPPEGGNYEPNYENNYKEDVSQESPEGLEFRDIPGSFDELVDTNPSFLGGHLPDVMKPSDAFFKMTNQGDSFDDIEFRNVGEQKGYIVSKNPREIVQQHGDGVSRILFNIPKGESKAESSNLHKVQYKGQNGEKQSESKVVETTAKAAS